MFVGKTSTMRYLFYFIISFDIYFSVIDGSSMIRPRPLKLCSVSFSPAVHVIASHISVYFCISSVIINSVSNQQMIGNVYTSQQTKIVEVFQNKMTQTYAIRSRCHVICANIYYFQWRGQSVHALQKMANYRSYFNFQFQQHCGTRIYYQVVVWDS